MEGIDKEIKKSAGEGVFIEKGVFHQIDVTFHGVFVMRLNLLINKRDLLRLEDSYGRAGTGYEDESHYLKTYIITTIFHSVTKKSNIIKRSVLENVV